jgi:hypothetical protein
MFDGIVVFNRQTLLASLASAISNAHLDVISVLVSGTVKFKVLLAEPADVDMAMRTTDLARNVEAYDGSEGQLASIRLAIEQTKTVRDCAYLGWRNEGESLVDTMVM